MKKHIVVTTSACGLDYYEQPHNVYTIYGHALIEDEANLVTLTDIEDFCAIQLRERYKDNSVHNITFVPPSVDEIDAGLTELLHSGYECIFVVVSGLLGCHENFNKAIARLQPEQQHKIHLYTSETHGFCAGLLALRAEHQLDHGISPEEITKELKRIEYNSMMLYCIMDLDNAPDNIFTQLLQDNKPHTAPYFPLGKATGDGQVAKIATLHSKEELVSRMAEEIQRYIGDAPYSGYTIAPSNHSISEWYCQALAEKLGHDHIATMPITPVMAQLAGIDCLAVRVYQIEEPIWNESSD